MNQVNQNAKRDRQWCAQKKTVCVGGGGGGWAKGHFHGREKGGNRRGAPYASSGIDLSLSSVWHASLALPSPEAERNYTGLANALLANVLFDSERLRLN